MLVVCDYCGKVYKRIPSKAKRGKKSFCSRDCWARFVKENMSNEKSPYWNRVEVKCSFCGKKKLIKASRLEKYEHHFCNKDCYDKYQRLIGGNEVVEPIVFCNYCGKEIRRKPSKLKKNRGHFCSYYCTRKYYAKLNKKPLGICIRDNLIYVQLDDDNEPFIFDYNEKLFKIISQHGWHINKDGYMYGWVNNQNVAAHHLILPSKKGYDVDHINRDKHDNRLSNLRYIKHNENTFNRGLGKNNKSGVTGVYWHKRHKRWIVKIGVGGKCMYLGCYKNYDDAVNVRLQAEERYYPGIKVN